MERQRSARHVVTSRSIEENAVRLVLEHGVDGVTVDMICDAAGISQRTFFNHFPTKIDAIVGTNGPKVDEAAVRRFLASDSADVLGELLHLVAGLIPGDPNNPGLSAARWRVISRTPSLMQVELDRMVAVQRELVEVLALRLTRHSAPDETPEDIRAQASLMSYLVAGIFRYSIEGDKPGMTPQPPDLERTRDILRQLLPKLGD